MLYIYCFVDLARPSTAPGGGSATTRSGSQDVVDEGGGGGGEEGLAGTECSSIVSGGGWSRVSRSHLISYSSVDDESFVSAQDTIADLKDFEDFEMAGGKYLKRIILKNTFNTGSPEGSNSRLSQCVLDQKARLCTIDGKIYI